MSDQFVIYTVIFVFALSLVVKSAQTMSNTPSPDASEMYSSENQKANKNESAISSTEAVDPLRRMSLSEDPEFDYVADMSGEDNEEDWSDIPKKDCKEHPNNVSTSLSPERYKSEPFDDGNAPSKLPKSHMKKFEVKKKSFDSNVEYDDWPEQWQEAWHEYKKSSKSGPKLPSPRAKERAKDSGEAKILIAQDEYMLIYVKHFHDCSMIHFQEELPDKTPEMKMCAPSGKMTWQWVYPFKPDKRHIVNVFASTTGELLYTETVKTLPMYPPPVKSARVTGANGWIQLSFKAVAEGAPNLVGYKIGYKPLVPGKESTWTYVLSRHVVYSAAVPYVRPVHPCKAFRVDNTFCVLLTDNVRLDDENDHKLFNITITPFRIVPDREEPLFPKQNFWTVFNLTACNWLVPGDCPAIGVNKRLRLGGRQFPNLQENQEHQQNQPSKKRRRHRSAGHDGNLTIPIPMAAREMLDLPPMTAEEKEAIEGPGGGDGWGGERRKPRDGRDFEEMWLTLLGALLGCVAVGVPLAHILGLRYGRYVARKRWTRMKAGLESISLASVRDAKRKKKRSRTFSAPEEKLFASFAAASATALTLGRKRQSSCHLGGGDGAKVHRVRASSLPTPVCVTALLPATGRRRLLATAVSNKQHATAAVAATTQDQTSFLKRMWPLRRK